MVSNDQEIRLLARARIDAGQLPPCEPVTLLGTKGNGSKCALCDVPITDREVEYEVELPGRRGSTWRFHIACHDVWREICDELWPPSADGKGRRIA